MKVEILKLDDNTAKCRVVDDAGNDSIFHCGLGTPAHQVLSHIVRNAVLTLAKKEADRQMRAFSQVHP
jgi:hypothetical protein